LRLQCLFPAPSANPAEEAETRHLPFCNIRMAVCVSSVGHEHLPAHLPGRLFPPPPSRRFN
jgi:hypothetical protein